jgi:hypothetical protein
MQAYVLTGTTAIGNGALAGENYCTALGHGSSAVTDTYTTCLGSNSTDSVDPVQYAVYFNQNLPAIGGTYYTLAFNTAGRVGYIPSTKKYKTDIIKMDDSKSLDICLKLEPVYFRSNVKPPIGEENPLEIGFIAEEVLPILPEVVKVHPKTGECLTVDYARITTVLVDAVKELNRKIESKNGNNDCDIIIEQKKIIDSQNKRIDELERKMSKLFNLFNII